MIKSRQASSPDLSITGQLPEGTILHNTIVFCSQQIAEGALNLRLV